MNISKISTTNFGHTGTKLYVKAVDNKGDWMGTVKDLVSAGKEFQSGPTTFRISPIIEETMVIIEDPALGLRDALSERGIKYQP